MKTKNVAPLIALMLVGCGSGGGGDSGTTAAATPAPVAGTPAGTPAGSPAAAAPVAGPVLGRTPPTATPPGAAPAPGQAPARVIAAEPVPAPTRVDNPEAITLEPTPPAAPEDTRPKILGSAIASMLTTSTLPAQGSGQLLPTFTSPSDQNGTAYGRAYAYQNYPGDAYTYVTGPFGDNPNPATNGNPNPAFTYAPVNLQVQTSASGGSLFIAEEIMVQSGWGGLRTFLRKDGGHQINAGDQLVQNTTLAQWTGPNGSYVQLQTGTFGDFVLTCWHFNLPNMMRRACTNWLPANTSATQWTYAGDRIIDDSNPQTPEPVTFYWEKR